MLKDIVSVEGGDLGVRQSDAERAANICACQIGTLEYAPDFGIDLKYFLESEFQIQVASFKSYVVQRLMESQVNVVNVISTVETLFAKFTFGIGSPENSGGFIT